MAEAELEDIDLNDYRDDAAQAPVSYGSGRPRRPYKQAPIDAFERSLLDSLDPAKPIAARPEYTLDDLVTEFPAQKEYSVVRGDRGRIERARTIAATLSIPFSQAYDGEASYTKKMQAKAPDLFKEAGTSLMRGIGGAYVNWGQGLRYLDPREGMSEATQTYIDYGKSLQQAYAPKLKAPEVSWKNFANPEFYATTVAEALPTTLSLVPAAIVSAYVGATGAAAIGLGAFGKVVAGALFGTAVTRPMESAMEAAGAKEEALAKGMSEADADLAADKVFKSNLALAGLDVAQLALAFTPLKVLGSAAPKALTARILATSAKVAGVAGSEGGEEALQEAFKQGALEGISVMDTLKRFNPEMKESAMVGAIFGVGLPVAGSVFNALTDRVETGMSPNVMETYQLAEESALAQGLDPVAARLDALDAVAATPEGKAHVEKVMGELKDLAEGKPIEPLTVEQIDSEIEKMGDAQEFVMGQEAEPDTMDIASDEAIDAIMAGDTSIDEALGLEPEVLVEEAMPQKGGPGQESTVTQAPTPEGGIDNLKALLEKPDDFVDFLIDKLGDDFDGAVGLRGLYKNEKLGKLRASRVWDDGNPTNKRLAGTSTVQISADWSVDPRAQIKRNIERFAKQVERYGDGDIALVTGDLAKGGDDIGEIIIPNAKAIHLWKKTPSPESSSPPSGGGQAFLISEESYQSALKSLKSKTSGFHAGIDPTALADLVKIGAYHIERGVRTFAEWSKVMIEQFGESVRTHLRDIWEQAGEIVKVESVEGATMPAKDVKHQVRKITGQANLSKLVSEDVALRAGMKKAEQAARIAFREGNKQAQVQAKADLRDILIKAKVKAEQFGFREGFKVAEKLTRKELTQAYQDEQEAMEETRKALVDIIQENLPPEMRGKFLDPLIAKLTNKNQNDLLDRIARMKDKLTKDELIDELENLQKMRGNINVEYQKRITALIGDINTHTFSSQTVENIESLIAFGEREGMPVGIGRKTLDILKRYEGRTAAEMTVEELKYLTDTARHLTELGKLKQQLKYKYKRREQQAALAKLLDSTVDADVGTDARDSALNTLKKGAWWIYTEGLNAPRMAEIIDGYKGKENQRLVKEIFTADLNAQWAIRTTIESAYQEMLDAGITEITEEREGPIMVNIRNREGADSQTITLMDKYGFKVIPQLTPAEERLIGILKKYSSDLYGDKIAALFEEVTNLPFPKLEGRILPLKYEGDFNRPPEEVILHTPHKVTQTEKGFTIERQAGIKKMPRVDLMAIFEEGINEQLWFLHMQPVLDDVKNLVKTKEYIKAAGTTASNWWKDHLDIVARRGWSVKAQHNDFTRLLSTWRGNITNAMLGYKLSSMLIQPGAVFEGMAHAQSAWGATVARKVFAEVAKTWIVPGYAKAIIDGDTTHALALRKGGEVAIQEEMAKKRSAFVRGGLALLQKADVRTAAGVYSAILKHLQDAGIPNAEQEAALFMDMSQSSSDVSMRPHILASGESARTWFTFQTFALNQWGIVAHDLVTKTLVKGEGAGRISGIVGLGLIVAGIMAAQTSREYLYELIRKRKLPDRSMLQDALYALPSSVPVFGNIYSMASNKGGADIPIVKLLSDVARAALIPTMKKEQAMKQALKSAESLAALFFGIPGTSQLVDVIEGFLFPGNEKGKIKAQTIKR